MAKAEDRPSWTSRGEIDERCPGLSLILKFKPRVDLTNLAEDTPLMLAVKANQKQSQFVVHLLVRKLFCTNPLDCQSRSEM